MKKFILIVYLSAALTAVGQSTWNMDRCIVYAVEHAASVEQARWDLISAKTDQTQAIADFFPSVQAQMAGQFSWGRNIDPETNTYNNVTTFNNGYGLYASMMLFDGGQTFNRWRQARILKEQSLSKLELAREDRAIAAMMAFVDAVYYSESISLAREKAAQSASMLKLTERQEELGLKGIPDVAQARATHADDTYNLLRQENLYNQSLLTLRSAMNFPVGEELTLDTINPMPVLQLEKTSIEDVYTIAATVNPMAVDARLGVKAAEMELKMRKGALMPTLSLNGGISTSYYNIMTGDYKASAFGDQFRNNRGEYIAATLTIPIFSNLSRIAGMKKAKYRLAAARVECDEKLRKLHDEVAQAVMDRDGYAREVVSLEAKVDAERKSYELSLRKYEEGLLSLIDLSITANTYYESRISLLQKQMLYTLKNKLVNYYKGEPLWISK